MLLSPSILLNQAWEIYKKRFWVFLVIMIVPVFAPSLLASILFPLGVRMKYAGIESFDAFNSGLLVAIGFLVLISAFIHIWSQIALLYAVKDRGENIGVKESYRLGWNKLASYFWISILSNFFIFGGLLLFFVPGLVFLIWFIFAPFVLIIENKRGFSSLLASKEYVKDHWRAVFWRFLIFGVLAWLALWVVSIIIGIMGLGNESRIQLYVGYMLLNPIGVIYTLLIYENLKKIKNESVINQKTEQTK